MYVLLAVEVRTWSRVGTALPPQAWWPNAPTTSQGHVLRHVGYYYNACAAELCILRLHEAGFPSPGEMGTSMAHGEPDLFGQDAALGLKRSQMRTSWQIHPMSSSHGDSRPG